MRTIMVEKTLYQFHELPEDAKAYAISTYWGEDWDYECVFEDAKEIGKLCATKSRMMPSISVSVLPSGNSKNFERLILMRSPVFIWRRFARAATSSS